MIERILHLHGALAYALIFALPALESSVFLGFVFPGEIAVILGGVLAFQGRITLTGAIVAAVTGAIIGDSVGYEVGKHYGARLLAGPLRRFIKVDHQARATAFLRRHGGKAVFIGRFTAALRALIPGMAGIAEIPYPTFLLYNALGGAVWGTGFTLLGYLAGNGYKRVQHIAGRASALLLGLLVTILIITAIARRIARNPDRLRAWWSRQLERPILRWFRSPLEFLGRRFKPREALGLGLTAGLAGVALIGVGFGIVVKDVAQRQHLVHFDAPFLDFLMHHTEGGVTRAMKSVTLFGNPVFVAAVAAILVIAFASRRAWPRAFLMVSAPLGAFVLERLVRAIVHRPRPPVHALVHATGSSFPSAHATIAAAFYSAVALLLSRATSSWKLKVLIWTVAFTFVSLIGFSRLYLRVHWLTDVVGGEALGALWTTVVVSGLGVWLRARDKAARVATGPPA
jgi:membrane protein DedA with SNARE-associated domain